MTNEEIERDLIEAGWKLDDGFSGHLMIGNTTVDTSATVGVRRQ